MLCKECAEKHLSACLVLHEEWVNEYDDRRFWIIGHLVEAERETPMQFREVIRTIRKQFQDTEVLDISGILEVLSLIHESQIIGGDKTQST